MRTGAHAHLDAPHAHVGRRRVHAVVPDVHQGLPPVPVAQLVLAGLRVRMHACLHVWSGLRAEGGVRARVPVCDAGARHEAGKCGH